MLEPDIVPVKEPELCVGIILPEDQYLSIEIELPLAPRYKCYSEMNFVMWLNANDNLKFELVNKAINFNLNGKLIQTAKIWHITPATKKITLANKTGLKVMGVAVGRGFHWVKKIDIYLAGSLEIRIVNNVLLVSNYIAMEKYLMCVATSEMGAACPQSLIESQTIVARSWMLANVETKHSNLGLDVCNDDCCQRYQGTTFLNERAIQGAMNTFGKVLLFNNKICDTRYFKSCGGITESFNNIWEGAEVPYLKPIADFADQYRHEVLTLDSEKNVRKWIESTPHSFCSTHIVPEKNLKKYLGNVDVEGEYFRWSFRYPQKEITALLNLKLNLEAQSILDIRPLKRGYSGRLTQVAVDYLDSKRKKQTIKISDQFIIRRTFHELFLYSSAFVVDIEKGKNNNPAAFILKGAGWGHGVGYCQIGALGMSLLGYSAEQIVYHYYPGSVLKKIY